MWSSSSQPSSADMPYDCATFSASSSSTVFPRCSRQVTAARLTSMQPAPQKPGRGTPSVKRRGTPSAQTRMPGEQVAAFSETRRTEETVRPAEPASDWSLTTETSSTASTSSSSTAQRATALAWLRRCFSSTSTSPGTKKQLLPPSHRRKQVKNKTNQAAQKFGVPVLVGTALHFVFDGCSLLRDFGGAFSPMTLLAHAQTQSNGWGASKYAPPKIEETTMDTPISVESGFTWIGNNKQTMLLHTTGDILYRSSDNGFAWMDITKDLDIKATTPSERAGVSHIEVSPADKNVVLAVGNDRAHYISENAGVSWRKIVSKNKIRLMHFHPTRRNWMLVTSWTTECDGKKDSGQGDNTCVHMAWVTKDLGFSFALVDSYIVQVGWGTEASNQVDSVFYTHYSKKSGNQPNSPHYTHPIDFSVTHNQGRSSTTLLSKGNRFMISDKFIFCAVVRGQQDDLTDLGLMVSTDGGGHFEQAQIPEKLEQKGYSVIDSSEGVVLLEVRHAARKYGNVYVSDETGTRYTRALWQAEDNSVSKVMGIDGIYMANVRMQAGANIGAHAHGTLDDAAEQDMEEDASNTKKLTKVGKKEEVVRSVITFDKGAYWEQIQGPRLDSLGQPVTDCADAQNCFLHLHDMMSYLQFPGFYTLDSAVGVIMATGNMGDSMRWEMDATHTYLSKDAGVTWTEIHRKPMIYEIGDHGGLLVMAANNEATNELLYSWNEGEKWYSLQMDRQGRKFNVDNIIIEPGATSVVFVVFGTRGGKGVVYHIDFSVMGLPLCNEVWSPGSVASDYVLWSPTDTKNSDQCLLGKQVTYTRRKPSAECFNGEAFERPVTKKSCQCTPEDYMCELGFTRNVGSMECGQVEVDAESTEGGELVVASECKAGASSYTPIAYRKVPGDVCDGGWVPQNPVIACPAGSAVHHLGRVALGLFVLCGLYFAYRNAAVLSFVAQRGMERFREVKYQKLGVNGGDLEQQGIDHALDTFVERHDDFLQPSGFDDDAPPLFDAGNNSLNADILLEEEPKLVKGQADRLTTPIPALFAPRGSGPGSSSSASSGSFGTMDDLL
ncbi:unnamed protein product [Amoebophrya sp. A25]|nr:unnamed protein product [Amoebophrya sp. A25]|eukprot:GSA25T00005149001.1